VLLCTGVHGDEAPCHLGPPTTLSIWALPYKLEYASFSMLSPEDRLFLDWRFCGQNGHTQPVGEQQGAL